MAIWKCKMCGGDLIREGDQNVATCDSCGTTMTLPSQSDEQISNLFNRANHYRKNFEFDRAAGVYEKILEENPVEAEAYWGIVLCRYGIEYVEDPQTHKRLPTCHRTRYESILSDADTLAALEHADGYARQLYEAEAREIDLVQKKILDLAKSEEAFDVFLCYKEKGPNGNRTRESVLAQEIYQELTEMGFQVFFARITLEDKLGEEYEPTIFAALNSARVMVAVGASRENLESVWVKNEWSRYLELIKRGEDKKLIPAYRDMDPYDLPEEFARLQALDMGKIGFLQDLTRGIQKILEGGPGKKDGKPREEGARAGSEETGLLRLVENGKTFLELEYFDRAKDLYHKVTDLYPEAWQGWWGLLSAETKNFSPDTWEACEIHVEDGRLALKDEYEKWKNTVERLAGEKADQVLEPYRAYLNACRKVMVEEQEIVLGKVTKEMAVLNRDKKRVDSDVAYYTDAIQGVPDGKYYNKRSRIFLILSLLTILSAFICFNIETERNNTFIVSLGVAFAFLGIISGLTGVLFHVPNGQLSGEQQQIQNKMQAFLEEQRKIDIQIRGKEAEHNKEEEKLQQILDATC